jgi:hypothetical protein
VQSYFSFVIIQKKFYKRKDQYYTFCNNFAQAAWLFFGQGPQQLVISFARTKETKQRKFAGCIFLPTPALFPTKQKELASLKQLFVFNVPKSTSA